MKHHNHGDTYVVIAESRAHPVTQHLNQTGFVFASMIRDEPFNDDAPAEDKTHRCGLSAEHSDGIGYYDIVRISEGARAFQVKEAHHPVGIFIPTGVSKKTVADHLRIRFGKGTTLLRPDKELIPEERHPHDEMA